MDSLDSIIVSNVGRIEIVAMLELTAKVTDFILGDNAIPV